MANGVLKNKHKKAQATLEASVAFVVIIILLAAMVKIWLWANNQIVERQIRFNATRVSAGTASDFYRLENNWPVYTPPKLTDEDK